MQNLLLYVFPRFKSSMTNPSQDYRSGELSTAEMKDLCIEEVTNLVKRFQEVCQDRIREILIINAPLGKG